MKPLTTLFTLTLLLIPVYVFALDPIVPCDGPDCQTCHVVQLGQNILTWLISIVAIIIAIVFVIGGLKMVMAAGNETQVTNARSMMTNAIIGFVILLAAWLIVDTVMKYFVKEGVLLGPWNQIECVDQPVFVAREGGGNGGGGGLGGNWSTQVLPTSLTHIDFVAAFGSELDTTTGRFENHEIVNPIYNPDAFGTSIPLKIPNITSNYKITIIAIGSTHTPAGFRGYLTDTRDFSGTIFHEVSWGMDNKLTAIVTPEDSGRVIYFNYRREPWGMDQLDESGGWKSAFRVTFDPTNEGPSPKNITPVNTSGSVPWDSFFGVPFTIPPSGESRKFRPNNTLDVPGTIVIPSLGQSVWFTVPETPLSVTVTLTSVQVPGVNGLQVGSINQEVLNFFEGATTDFLTESVAAGINKPERGYDLIPGNTYFLNFKNAQFNSPNFIRPSAIIWSH